MVINIPDETINLAQNDKNVSILIRYLFSLFETEKHKWYINNNDIELFDNPETDIYRDFIQKSIVESVYQSEEPHYIVRVFSSSDLEAYKERMKGKRDITINSYLNGKRIITQKEDMIHDCLCLDLIGTFLGQPLKIVVENIKSDKVFIKKCISLIGKQDPDNLFLEFINGGGSDVPKVIEHYEGKYRVICIVDCDRICPEHIEESKVSFHRVITETCKKYGYICHFLQKREVENYIPDSALIRHIKKNRQDPKDYAYFELEPIQKDFFDLKKGIKKKDLKYQFWLDLFGINNEYAITKFGSETKKYKGFGDKVWMAFYHVNSADELKSRDNLGELELIVNKILNLL